MGGERVSNSSPVEGSGSDDSAPFITYTKQFYDHFPYYLSIGMTYEQYWEDHADLVKYYRKAYELSNEKKNQELWLQGMYFYEAIARVSPLLQAFAKSGTKAEPYLDKPYPLTTKDAVVRKREREEKEFALNKAKFEAMASSVNQKFKSQSEVNSDGDRDRPTSNRDNG